MNKAWLEHLLTAEEKRTFAEQGYLIIENAIPQDLVERATVVVDQITAEQKAKEGMGPSDGINILDFIGRDEVFLELLDYPTTFPKVWASSAGTYNFTTRIRSSRRPRRYPAPVSKG